MSFRTSIQWCDTTANPVMGCDGCGLWSPRRKTCDAGVLHIRSGGVTAGYASRFDRVTPFPGRMAKVARLSNLTGKKRLDTPWLDGYPRQIFISDMSDAFSSSVSFEFFVKEVITNTASEYGNRPRWLWLTKLPNRMAESSSWLNDQGARWPTDLWVGTSVTSQATACRIRHLQEVGHERTARFLSIEPQVEEIDFGNRLLTLDWILRGGESGRRARAFDVAWAVRIIEECSDHRIPYFLKQLGSVFYQDGRRIHFEDSHAGDWSEWPAHLRVREAPEM